MPLAESFLHDGFVRIDNAFPRSLADEGRQILWADTGCDPNDPRTWTQPVIRLHDYQQPPFVAAANTAPLTAAFDELVGAGRWLPRVSLGTFPIRFPHPTEPNDTGWHCEASYAGADGSWRLNVQSQGRALLMLFLFSDVGPNDAPTRIRIGSHLDVPGLLEPHGDAGIDAFELGPPVAQATAHRPETLATGPAGTVFLCHPFLVHAAQPHRGTAVRFMAQPPLYPAEPIRIDRDDQFYSPVELAIRSGLIAARATPANH